MTKDNWHLNSISLLRDNQGHSPRIVNLHNKPTLNIRNQINKLSSSYNKLIVCLIEAVQQKRLANLSSQFDLSQRYECKKRMIRNHQQWLNPLAIPASLISFPKLETEITKTEPDWKYIIKDESTADLNANYIGIEGIEQFKKWTKLCDAWPKTIHVVSNYLHLVIRCLFISK